MFGDAEGEEWMEVDGEVHVAVGADKGFVPFLDHLHTVARQRRRMGACRTDGRPVISSAIAVGVLLDRVVPRGWHRGGVNVGDEDGEVERIRTHVGDEEK